MFFQRVIPVFIFVSLSILIQAQVVSNDTIIKRCAHDEYIKLLESEYPGFKDRRAEMETEIQNWMIDNKKKYQDGQKSVIIIPVVFHVLYNTPEQNIPHIRIQEQMQILNEDFNKANSDVNKTPLAFRDRVANVEFYFCLAKRDPNGNWTNGVTRRYVNKTSFSYHDDQIIKTTSLGGRNNWDPDRYMNIWVVNLTGGTLGYTQPPGGPKNRDGIVIGYRFVGSTGTPYPYNQGRTATHEVGHWFNLIHIWGDDGGACWGTDLVDDTPNQASEFYGCPTFPQVDACTPDSPGVMFMNYMDYVDDACMVMFTKGQKARMRVSLDLFRSGLKTSKGCEPAVGVEEIPVISDLTIYPNPGNGRFNLELLVNNRVDVKYLISDMIGQVLLRNEFVSHYMSNEIIDMSGYPPGVYILHLKAGDELITRKLIIK